MTGWVAAVSASNCGPCSASGGRDRASDNGRGPARRGRDEVCGGGTPSVNAALGAVSLLSCGACRRSVW